MRMFLLMSVGALLLSSAACRRDHDFHHSCHSSQPACMDTVPNEACQAVFQRWFFDQNTQTCRQVTYSGCSARGFATQAECVECAALWTD